MDIYKIIKKITETTDIEKIAEKLIGAISIVTSINIAIKSLFPKNKELENLVVIPTIMSSSGFMKLDKAKCCLMDAGFKTSETEVKPKIVFRDRSDFDVVGISSKRKKRLPFGATIILYHTTPAVIEKSNQLFEQSERQKAEVKYQKSEKKKEKIAKKAEQKLKAQQKAKDFARDVQPDVVDAAPKAKKRIFELITNLLNKEKTHNITKVDDQS